LWPKSYKEKPNQYLKLSNDRYSRASATNSSSAAKGHVSKPGPRLIKPCVLLFKPGPRLLKRRRISSKLRTTYSGDFNHRHFKLSSFHIPAWDRPGKKLSSIWIHIDMNMHGDFYALNAPNVTIYTFPISLINLDPPT